MTIQHIVCLIIYSMHDDVEQEDQDQDSSGYENSLEEKDVSQKKKGVPSERRYLHSKGVCSIMP